MSKIVELYEKLSLSLGADPKKAKQLYTELAKIVSNAHTQDMNSDEGFCFKFTLPLIAVNNLFKTIDLTPKEIHDAFEADWGSNAMSNRMYRDPYYQILLLLMYYGIKENQPNLVQNACLIALFKLWNGRKLNFVKFCDKKVMKYVTSHMLTNRHLFTKHDSPLSMLRDHFLPSLLKTYEPLIKKDPSQGTQRWLSQAWGRIQQLFIQNMRTDIKTGEKLAQSGILPMYMKAKEEGLSISSPKLTSSESEEGPNFAEFSTVNNRDEIISLATGYITMNMTPKYPEEFIKQINTKTTVSAKVIETIMKALHNHKFHDVIHDLFSVILSRTNINEKADICNPNYNSLVQSKIISSKNNVDTKKVENLTNVLLNDIFENILKRDFKVFSNVQQIKLRTVIILGLVYNLQQSVCRGS